MNNTLIIYSLISFFILFLSARISYKLNLVDTPNKRKIHSKPTVYTGGIAISIALVFSILILEISDNYLNLILSMSFLISLVGLIDDKFSLNVGGKLSLQIIPIFYLVFFENFFLKDLGDYSYFKLELGAFVMPFSLICVLFLINAFNYFDGLDGTLGFTSISVLAILYFLISDQNLQLFLIIIFVPLSIFLCFNLELFKFPKMFLGDSGSLLIGFIISFILIYLANRNYIHPIILAWSIVIFVYEFLSINIIRLKNNKNPFKPGQDHLHHILLKKTKSLFLTNFYISIANVILFIVGYNCFLLISPLFSLFLFIILFIFFLILQNKILRY